MEEDWEYLYRKTKAIELQNYDNLMKLSRKIVKRKSFELAKHQGRYQEFLNCFYHELGVIPLQRSPILKENKTTLEFQTIPDFLLMRLIKVIQREKEEIFSILYDLPLHVKMEHLRKDITVSLLSTQEPHRIQIASICEILSINSFNEVYTRATHSIEWINALKHVFKSFNQ